MNYNISTNYINDLKSVSKDLEGKYSPSTFKYVKYSNFLDSFIESLFPICDNDKKNICLYLKEMDEKIDTKSIENDVAVVAKDLIIAFRNYDNRITESRKR